MIRKEEIEEAAYDKEHRHCTCANDGVMSFIEGAEWAIRKFEENRLAACNIQTKDEAEREQQFVPDFLTENNRIPTFSDCIEITRKDVINKACEWLRHDMLDNRAFQGRLERMAVIDGIIDNFRKAMGD